MGVLLSTGDAEAIQGLFVAEGFAAQAFARIVEAGELLF